VKKNTFLKMTNPILAAAFLYQIATGLLHGIIPRESFGTIHVSGAVFLIIFAIVHLMLNWSWVKANFLTDSKTGRGNRART
jgi:hypothetical protein